MTTKLTAAQREFLIEHQGAYHEVFAPNAGTLRALRRLGLIETTFIGMRWWGVKLTPTGSKAALSIRPCSYPSIPCDGPNCPHPPAGRAEVEK